jgi:2-dehydropantoate 2-reductase
VAATIAGEFERLEPGRIIHRSRLARLAVHASGEQALAPVTSALTAFGCRCDFVPDEATLLWSKLVMLAPFALATTAAAAPIGAVRDDPAWRPRLEACAREACRVAVSLGAQLDEDATVGMLHGFEPSMRSSMQKDVAAGRPPELDAIAGPILRGGAAAGIPVPATEGLADLVRGRSRSLG